MNPIQQTLTPPASGASGTTQRVEARTQQLQAGRSGASAPAAGGAGASGTSAGDTVSISQSARQLLDTASVHGAGSGAASPQRLNALRQSIAAGTYTIDARQIAQGLLRDSRALSGAASGGEPGAGA